MKKTACFISIILLSVLIGCDNTPPEPVIESQPIIEVSEPVEEIKETKKMTEEIKNEPVIEEPAVYNISEMSDLNTIKLYDTVIMGEYEQDNNLDNGKEPIEWIVVSLDDEKALLYSKKALDYMLFSSKEPDLNCVWESSTLREWMNNDFYNNAFSADEQSLIISSTINNPIYVSVYDKPEEGKNTTDKVFCLSMFEYQNLFEGNDSGIFTISDYASVKGSETLCWSRTNITTTGSMYVFDGHGGGFIDYNCDYISVVPAMYITL